MFNQHKEEQFSLSFDIDWAADEVIEFTISPLIQDKIPFTLFITHNSPYIQKVLKDFDFIEPALHPNFNPLFSGDFSKTYTQILDELQAMFPKAQGVRAHSHVVSSQILDLYEKRNLKYESGIYIPNLSGLKSFQYTKKFARIPHFFQDDAHILRGGGFDLDYLNLGTPGIKLFDFHPIHVFLNTPSLEFYEKNKTYYKNAKELEIRRNREVKGTLDLYESVIRFLKQNRNKTKKVIDLISNEPE